MEIDPNDEITTAEAGRILGLSSETVRRLMRARELPGSDVRLDGAKRAEWRTSRKACWRYRRARPGHAATASTASTATAPQEPGAPG